MCYFKVSYCLRLLSCSSFHSNGLLSRSRSHSHYLGLSYWILFVFFIIIRFNCNGSMVYGSHHSFSRSILHVTGGRSISYDISFYSLYSCCWCYITVICHQLSLQHYREYCLQLPCVCVSAVVAVVVNTVFVCHCTWTKSMGLCFSLAVTNRISQKRKPMAIVLVRDFSFQHIRVHLQAISVEHAVHLNGSRVFLLLLLFHGLPWKPIHFLHTHSFHWVFIAA